MSSPRDDEVLPPRLRHWLEHLHRCEQSAMSVKAYAAEHRLSATALYSARRDLKARGLWPRKSAQASTPRFVSVRVEPSAVAVVAMTVRLPDGVVVEVAAGCAPEAGAALVRALMAPVS